VRDEESHPTSGGPVDLTEHGGSRGVTLKKISLFQGIHYRAKGLQTYPRWRVRNQERRTSTSGGPVFQAALLWQVGLYSSGVKIFLATSETAMVIRKQNISKPEGREEQRSTNRTDWNGNHTGELNMDHLKFHLTSESGTIIE
jgi:hypothetical protein